MTRYVNYLDSEEFKIIRRIAIKKEIKNIKRQYEILPTTLSLEDLLAGPKRNRGRRGISRQPNNFILYRRDLQAELNSEDRKITNQEISRIASKKWENEEDAVKKFFAILAESARNIHKALFPFYRYRPNKKSKRGHRRRNTLASTSTRVESYELSPLTSSEESPNVASITMDVDTDTDTDDDVTTDNKPLNFSESLIFINFCPQTDIPSSDDATPSSDASPNSDVTCDVPLTDNVYLTNDIFSDNVSPTNNIFLTDTSLSNVSPMNIMNGVFLTDDISSSDVPPTNNIPLADDFFLTDGTYSPCTQHNYLLFPELSSTAVPNIFDMETDIPCDEYVNNGYSHSIFGELDPLFDFSTNGENYRL